MRITLTSPSRAYLSEYSTLEISSLEETLTFTNTSVAHDIKRHYNNFWLRSKDREKWEADLLGLKKRLKRTLVFKDNTGTFVYPGSIPYLNDGPIITSNIVYPIPKKVAWAKPLPFELYPYQEESWKLLLEAKHANVELCTGSGKSAILLKLCRETGFRTAIIAPSKSIFFELLEKFEYHFGKGMIGTFGAGRKRLGKRFTICIGDSIVNIAPGSEEWKFFSTMEMIAVDESHTWGAETLEAICFSVLANIPYRVFLSGTQTRGDGTKKLLQAIIGPTVYTLTTEQAVKGGYICPHDYRIVSIESSNPNFNSQDALEMKRAHFLRNRNIAAFAAKLANAEALLYKKQTLILVEELSQIAMLLPQIKVPVAIAHSETKKERLQELGFEKVDPSESVEKFNKAEALVLIGTSCISTGTNIYPTHNTVNYQGGASEIKTRQGAVGRSVRLGKQNPWANRCVEKVKSTIWDFNVFDIEIMTRHLDDRISYYNESGSEIKKIKLNK